MSEDPPRRHRPGRAVAACAILLAAPLCLASTAGAGAALQPVEACHRAECIPGGCYAIVPPEYVPPGQLDHVLVCRDAGED